jgi:acyl carrier protein
MIFCLHLLAHHQDIQDEARESIRKILIKYNGSWCYEAVMEMSFVEQIIEGDSSNAANIITALIKAFLSHLRPSR